MTPEELEILEANAFERGRALGRQEEKKHREMTHHKPLDLSWYTRLWNEHGELAFLMFVSCTALVVMGLIKIGMSIF